jgi:hypothetical protein
MHVLHISSSPLVGAPLRIAKALNMHSSYCTSSAWCYKDYSGSKKGVFASHVYNRFKNKSSFEAAWEKADIIHVHNALPRKWQDKCRKVVGKKLVYQVHSPIGERPLYQPLSLRELDLPFSAYLVVAQYQPRFYPDYQLVPNIVPFETMSIPHIIHQKPVILFTPTHRVTGRWVGKSSETFEKNLSSLKDLAHIQFYTGLSPKDLWQKRLQAHITIDEVITGGFHQVSLEGLAAGHGVVNNADEFATSSFTHIFGEAPPFIRANEHNLCDVLMPYLKSPDLLADTQQKSHAYFRQHLHPSRTIQIFERLYSRIM